MAAVTAMFNWSQNCVVKVARPHAGWLKKTLAALSRSSSSAPLTQPHIRGVVERVGERAARGYADGR